MTYSIQPWKISTYSKSTTKTVLLFLHGSLQEMMGEDYEAPSELESLEAADSSTITKRVPRWLQTRRRVFLVSVFSVSLIASSALATGRRLISWITSPG